jgi:hypothetical protein
MARPPLFEYLFDQDGKLKEQFFPGEGGGDGDYCLLPIHVDTDVSDDPLKTVLPAGYVFAEIVYSATDGTGAGLTLKKTWTPEDPGIDLTDGKVDIAGYDGLGATFIPELTGGGVADFMLKLSVS